MNKFLKEFKDRGFFYQCTNETELSDLMDKEKIKGYIGFDCTAESLHVGSLLQIMCLRLLQKNGHRPIVLLGGGTTRIGDPSGKDKTRKILDEDEIEKNIKNIQNILKQFLDNDNPDTKPIFMFGTVAGQRSVPVDVLLDLIARLPSRSWVEARMLQAEGLE